MHAAALALYTAFSISPLIILLISLLSSLNFNLQDRLVEEINILLGPDAGTLLASIIQSSEARKDLAGPSGFFGIMALIVSASAIFGQLQYSLNIIWEADHKTSVIATWIADVKEYFKKRLVSFGLVLSFILITMISLVASSILSTLITAQDDFLKRNLSLILNFTAYTLVFGAIFRTIPDRPIPWRQAFFGGTITTTLFVLGKAGIGYYLGRAAVGSAYGAAGSLIVFLAWVYYSSIIIFIGAEITSLITLKKKFKEDIYEKTSFQII